MQLVMGLLAACHGDAESELPFEDTSYKGFPVLSAAAIACDAANRALVLTARTRGWHEDAWVHLYLPGGGSHDMRIESIFATQDEYCDYMRATLPLSRLSASSCDELDLATVTAFFQVNFEEGCAGCALTDGSDPNTVLEKLIGSPDVALCDPQSCIYDTEVRVELGSDVEPCVEREPRRG